jgi:hypothetical protein
VPFVAIVSIVSPVIGMGGEAAPRQRRRDCQRTSRELLSHLEHVTPPIAEQRR